MHAINLYRFVAVYPFSGLLLFVRCDSCFANQKQKLLLLLTFDLGSFGKINQSRDVSPLNVKLVHDKLREDKKKQTIVFRGFAYTKTKTVGKMFFFRMGNSLL